MRRASTSASAVPVSKPAPRPPRLVAGAAATAATAAPRLARAVVTTGAAATVAIAKRLAGTSAASPSPPPHDASPGVPRQRPSPAPSASPPAALLGLASATGPRPTNLARRTDAGFLSLASAAPLAEQATTRAARLHSSAALAGPPPPRAAGGAVIVKDVELQELDLEIERHVHDLQEHKSKLNRVENELESANDALSAAHSKNMITVRGPETADKATAASEVQHASAQRELVQSMATQIRTHVDTLQEEEDALHERKSVVQATTVGGVSRADALGTNDEPGTGAAEAGGAEPARGA